LVKEVIENDGQTLLGRIADLGVLRLALDLKESRDANDALVEALEHCLNYITNCENEFNIVLPCGEIARQTIKSAKGE